MVDAGLRHNIKCITVTFVSSFTEMSVFSFLVLAGAMEDTPSLLQDFIQKILRYRISPYC